MNYQLIKSHRMQSRHCWPVGLITKASAIRKKNPNLLPQEAIVKAFKKWKLNEKPVTLITKPRVKGCFLLPNP